MEPTSHIRYNPSTLRIHRKTSPLAGVRAAIYDRIQQDAGISFMAIAKACDLAIGQAQHHLRFLETEGKVRSLRMGRFRRYFPASFPATATMVAALRTPVRGDVLLAAQANPGATMGTIAGRFPTSRQAILYHIKELVKLDPVTVERRGRFRRVTAKGAA